MEVEYISTARDYEARKKALVETTFHGTFPQIFVGSKFIGGYTELMHAVRAGTLKKLVNARTRN